MMHSFLKKASKLGFERSSSVPRAFATQTQIQDETKTSERKLKPISKSMRAYIDRVREHEEKMRLESQQYQTGKRFLANMMGEDPATFTQEKVDEAISYLLPSGLYEKLARPMMKPPEELFPALKAAAFDETGRPFHYLFFTKYFQSNNVQHEAVGKIKELNELQDEMHLKRRQPSPEDQFNTIGTKWLEHKELQKMLNESFSENHYNNVIEVLEVLQNHPLSNHAEEFLRQYRKTVENVIDVADIPAPLEAADGRLYVESKGSRNRSTAKVIVHSPGTGKIVINKLHDITYFADLQARQQVLFPLQLSGLLNKVDIQVVVHGGGETVQSGAIRYALSLALRSFIDKDTLLKLQIAGLLTFDRRHKERNKIGKDGARRGYTWLKR